MTEPILKHRHERLTVALFSHRDAAVRIMCSITTQFLSQNVNFADKLEEGFRAEEKALCHFGKPTQPQVAAELFCLMGAMCNILGATRQGKAALRRDTLQEGRFPDAVGANQNRDVFRKRHVQAEGADKGSIDF